MRASSSVASSSSANKPQPGAAEDILVGPAFYFLHYAAASVRTQAFRWTQARQNLEDKQTLVTTCWQRQQLMRPLRSCLVLEHTQRLRNIEHLSSPRALRRSDLLYIAKGGHPKVV